MLIFLFAIPAQQAFSQSSQAITEIVTSYGGYFKSGSAAVNTVKPDNSHNLLAFTFNNVRYSTGVDNGVLTSHGDVFQNTIFKCLPINTISGTVTSNTKTGLGALYDAVLNGPSNPVPVNNIPQYLTDGVNGLDMGTGIANLPAGILDFNIDSVNPASIGDGVPDILITQIADPSSGTDQYSFLDAANQVVGMQHGISFNGISSVANWTADFYEASTTPMTLAVGFTQTDRPVRLWAADFSYFGITSANYNTVSRFRIQLNGSSDIAFIAYNNTSTIILPLTLTNLKSSVQNKNIRLSWETQQEVNTSHFEIERSRNGIDFMPVGRIDAAGNSNNLKRYQFTDQGLQAGVYLYRLKQFDIDGRYTYSNILKETISEKQQLYTIFPNPANDHIYLVHPSAGAAQMIQLYTVDGKLIKTIYTEANASQTRIDISALLKGTYILSYYENGKKGVSRRFSK